jgi:hypothetical protein
MKGIVRGKLHLNQIIDISRIKTEAKVNKILLLRTISTDVRL